jgi:hypothetical protein
LVLATGMCGAFREGYEQFGYESLFDRRRRQPSPQRLPSARVEKVLALYREKCFDLNVRHFHEKLREQHPIDLSYTWVKTVLQGAGLVARQRGVHRERRPRRPLPGMLLHIDGSHHQWSQDERWYDRIVILEDATREILLRAAEGGGIDADGDGGAQGSDGRPGRVLRSVP